MPVLFTFAVVVVVISGIIVLVGLAIPPAKHVVRLVGTGILGLGLLLLFFSSVVSVGTKEVGVKTTFGRPSGSLTNGIHFKAPWEQVTTLDDAIQTDSYEQNVGNANGTCITVRIARQATACVDTSIRWQIKEGTAPDTLFRNYRDFANIRASLVTRELQSAVNVAFANYDPLGVDTNGDSTQTSLVGLAGQVTSTMNREIGDTISVQSVIIPVLHFDPSTQDRINSLQAQVAQTRIAQQAQKTATAQAAANKALAASVSNSPNVLVSKCLDILQESVNKGQSLPAAFSCFPGTGGSASVAVK
jgi:regulator of protease activity HflC (stomatin/prohibitin superfamily)